MSPVVSGGVALTRNYRGYVMSVIDPSSASLGGLGTPPWLKGGKRGVPSRTAGRLGDRFLIQLMQARHDLGGE